MVLSDYLTVEQAAAARQVTPRQVRHLIACGVVPRHRVGGWTLLVAKADLPLIVVRPRGRPATKAG